VRLCSSLILCLALTSFPRFLFFPPNRRAEAEADPDYLLHLLQPWDGQNAATELFANANSDFRALSVAFPPSLLFAKTHLSSPSLPCTDAGLRGHKTPSSS
jgi:hypothetical protein